MQAQDNFGIDIGSLQGTGTPHKRNTKKSPAFVLASVLTGGLPQAALNAVSAATATYKDDDVLAAYKKLSALPPAAPAKTNSKSH
jgi:hypothetical protein